MRDKDYKVEIDGKLVTLAELKKAYKFWQEYKWSKGTNYCPICGTSFDDAGLFVCEECGELLPIEERCTEHHEFFEQVCRDCCEECNDEEAYDYAVNAEIDEMRGK